MSNYVVRILIFAICLVLQACSTAPQKQPEPTITETVSTAKEIEQPTAIELLQAIKAEDNDEQVIEALLAVVESEASQNCDNALQLINILNNEPLNTVQKNRLDWQNANCLSQKREYESVLSILTELKVEPSWREQYDHMLYQAYLATNDWVQAAEALYRLPGDPLIKSQQIWDLLQNLTNEEIANIKSAISNLTPFIRLLDIQRNFESPSELRRDITRWQSDNQHHAFATELPASLANVVSIVPDSPMNIGVVLPLSGRYKEQGEAAKQGILMATMASGFSSDHQITFFDSNDKQALTAENMEGIQLVIGPLLRENIDLVLQLLPPDTPMLSLNRSDSVTGSRDNVFYLSLAPEDEAQQIARHLKSIGKVSPLVIASNSSSYQRMSDAFNQAWELSSKQPPDVLDFNNTSDLKKAIAEALDIETSKSRINQIKAMTNVEVHAMERNRRDIDAIVIFASAAQTILINPIIESSISPFAEIIPVYASSRSFSQRLNKNGLRDLRNLQFIEMPWMLPSREFNYLQNKSSVLWPNRSDSHNRLFALGYDAVSLIPRIRYLAQLKNQQFQGMTGTLTLNERQESVRTLRWASIEEERVTVALD